MEVVAVDTIVSLKRSFDLIHGKGSFSRLRSMLNDPELSYEEVGHEFGLTRQRIAQLAAELKVDARSRQRERVLRRAPSVIEKDYPPDVLAAIGTIR